MSSITNTKEVWVPVRGYEQYYEVSNLGRIRSYHMRGIINHNGYRLFSLTIPGDGQKHHFMHRMVAEAFISNLENKSYVHHKNGNRLDNHLDNLEWVTPAENLRFAWEGGTLNNRGEGNRMSKLTEKQVRIIRSSGLPTKELMKMFGVSSTTVNHTRRGVRWQHIV